MPATYTVERTRTIPAPPDRVFALLTDFRAWQRWSPWEGVDPQLERSYGGSPSGVGATYAWSGNRKAGRGRMEILRVEEDREVDVSLEFEKPFKSRNQTSFLLTPVDGGATEVTWRMVGPRPLLMRAAGPLLDMDRLVGRDFEKGLANLATAAGG